MSGPLKKVPHPQVKEWLGESAGNNPEFVVWDTNDGLNPTITHDRDLMMDDGQIEQDYRFLDYDFGIIKARAYLDYPELVHVELGSQRALPADVALYLKSRFAEIKVMGQEGYETIWKI